MKVISGTIYSLFAIFGFTQCDPYHLTTHEVPLYIRQSWTALTDPVRTYCIAESGVDPTYAYKYLRDIEARNNANLKRYMQCVHVQLNLIEETTGVLNEKEFVRQVEGCTQEVFRKCNEKVKNLVDVNEKSFAMSMCIIHEVAKPKSPQHHEPSSDYHH